jgi:hypothetical protein
MAGVSLLAFALICGAGLRTVYAQGQSASLVGTVNDESKAVVPGADVVLTHEATGTVRRTVTNSEGFFSIVGVPAGVYSISIEVSGFAKWVRTGITLQAGDRVTVSDILLNVATAQQQVEVVAAGPTLIPVSTGEKSQVITAKQIQNLAVLGRSADELLKILPGVVYTNPDDPGGPAGFTVQFNRGIGNYNVAGTRNTQVANMSDGANVIDPGCNCGSAVTPNMDMVQEVQVQTANFAAENALGPVVFNSVSKSGTSEFHGEAYIYARHSVFNSRDWRNTFFKTEKPQDSFYFPGFNIGGPLSKARNKLFFFAGFELQRQNHDLGVRPAIVPTEAMRKGDFTDLSYIKALNGYDANLAPKNDAEGNNNWGGKPITANMLQGGRINPAAIDKGGQLLVNLLPLPNKDPLVSNGYNYTSNVLNPEHRYQALVRVDYDISDNTKLYTRFNHESQASPYPFTLWWYNSNDVPWPGNLKGDYNTWSSSTSLVNVLDPTTTNEVVFAATYWGMPHEIRDKQAVSRKSLGYPYRGLFKQNTTDVVPNFTDWGGGVADFIQPGGLDDPTIFGNKWLVSVRDNFSKVVGTHTMKYGFFFEYVTNDEPTTGQDNGQLEPTNWGGNSTGNAYADLLLGRVGGYAETTKNITGLFRKREWSGYAQDSWKATRRLTLEYGARFQHQGWMYEKNGLLFGFDPKLYNPASKITDYSGLVSPHLGHDVPRSIRKTPALLVSPRFGFAFDLTGKGNTVIRGGGGVYQYHDRNGDVFGVIANPPLRQSTYICCGIELKDVELIDPTTQIQKSNLSVLEPNSDRIPKTYSWSFTLSHRLPFATVLEASYVGNSSSNQMTCTNCSANNLNAVREGAMIGFPFGEDPNNYRPYKNYGTILVKSHSLSQNYHSMQLTANRQTGRVNYAMAYTFSKTLGIGGDSFNVPVATFDTRRRSYGPLPYDRTHGLSIAYNAMLPGNFKNAFAKMVVNGWQVSGITQWQSGGPLSGIQFSGTMADGQQISAIRVTGTPDVAARPFLTCDPRKDLAENQYANPNCFKAPLIQQNGIFVMPYMKYPAFQNHDLSLFKNWGFSEHKRLQFRVSMYNFLNHPLPFFAGSDPGLAMNFVNGVPDQTTLQKFGRTTLKRGRRLMQFALKFQF